MMDLSIASLISRVIILVIAFTVHELSHAWVADRLGDPTPRSDGRLTLNPLAHLDPFGSLMLLVTGFGWAKPVRVSPFYINQKSRAGMMLVSMAGPFSNIVMAVLGSIPLRMGLLSLQNTGGQFLPTLTDFALEFVFINLLLAFFNLIPIPPLDGAEVLTFFLPSAGKSLMNRIRPYSSILLLVLIFVAPRFNLPILSWLVGTPTMFLFSILVL